MAKQAQNMPVQGATLDASMNPVLVQGFSRLTGVDLREGGALPKFPGFVRSTTTFAYSDSTIDFFEYVELQKGSETGTLRGFVTHDSANNVISFDYYDTHSSLWRHTDLATDAVGDGDTIDVTTAGKFLYLTYGDNSSPIVQVQFVFYFDSFEDNDTFNVEAMGVGKDKDWGDIASAAAGAGSGRLSAGDYGVGIRLLNQRRNVRTPISEVVEDITVNAGDHIADTGAISLPSGWDSTDTDIELYRTIANGSRLYREVTMTFSTTPSLKWGHTSAPNGLSDAGLVRKNLLFENNLDLAGKPPASNRILHYQGITIMRLIGDDLENALTDLVFSPSHEFRPEDFPRNQLFRVDSGLGPIVTFQRPGDFAVGFTPIAMIRFQRAGTQMTADVVNLGWGPSSRNGVATIGSSLLVVTTKGIYLTNANDGSMIVLGAVDRLITRDWVANIAADSGVATPNIHVATDELLGATFVTNNATRECLIYWHASQRISLLEDVPWLFSTTGADPVTGGPRRAWFSTPRDGSAVQYQLRRRWAADVERTGSNTMLGVTLANNTVNGTITSAGSTTQLIDTAGAWDNDVLGATAHIFTAGGDGRPSSSRLTTNSETVLLTGSMSTTTNWTEEVNNANDARENQSTVGRTGWEFRNVASFGSAGDDAWIDLIQTGATFDSTDEPYEVRAVPIKRQVTNPSGPSLRIDAFEVWGRLSQQTELRPNTGTGADGYGVIIVWTTTSRDGTALAKGTSATLYLVKRSSGTVTVLASEDSTDYLMPDVGEWTLGIRFNGTTITAHLNGEQKLSATDSDFTSGSTAMGVGLTNSQQGVAEGEGLFVRSFTVVGITATTLTLDTAISGKVTGDAYTISPVPYRVTLPTLGGADKLWRRHTMTEIGAYITGLTSPSSTVNSRMRFQGFRAGSTTEEAGSWVTLSETVGDLFGQVNIHGLGIQSGLEVIEAGGSFELVGLRTLFEAGDSGEIG